MNRLSNIKMEIGNGYDSPFLNKNDIYQDGTVPFCRDAKGKLWGMSGHSHMGHIGMFCGDTLEDMKEVYPALTNFCVGSAEFAFSGIKYPDGIKARGSIWPFGLYICPKTNRFFCFFHNETGWNGKGTAYDSRGYCETPAFDSDFRHVGLMHSDDEGRNWTFDRWVLTANHVSCTDSFIPDNQNIIGQKSGVVQLGSGDFSLFVEPDGEYIYIIYTIATVDMNKSCWVGCDAYIARTRKRDDGVMGDFVKYYDGSFSEAGNFGKESVIVKGAWHARAVYSEDLKCYVLISGAVALNESGALYLPDYAEFRTSTDLINWSEPISFEKDGEKFGNHYQAIVPYHGEGNPAVVKGKKMTLLTCHNGTDVKAFDAEIE